MKIKCKNGEIDTICIYFAVVYRVIFRCALAQHNADFTHTHQDSRLIQNHLNVAWN